MARKLLLCLLINLLMLSAKAQYDKPQCHVYQYAVKVGTRTAYLWIPPKCGHIKGVIVSLANLLERNWLEEPLIRQTAADIGLGIIWIGAAQRGDQTLTTDMKPGMEQVFQQMLDDLAAQSGYVELKTAPVIPMGHSANGHFAWTFANAFPNRTIACIPVKTVPLPDTLLFKNIPLCYVVAQTTEWPQYRVPDPATKPGDRDFYWPVVRQTALRLRAKSGDNLIAVVTDPGGGHFDWNENLARFITLFITKACKYRLPDDGRGKLRPLTQQSGWLTDTKGMEKDEFAPAPFALFKGHAANSYWFFDKETAQAATAFEGDRIDRKKQMPTFVQDGKAQGVAKLGYAALKFQPDTDGLSFSLKGDFLTELPPELIGAGTKLGHTVAPIKFRVITGPAIQTGPNLFKLQFDRAGMGGELWLQEDAAADKQYRHATQPGMIRIPARLTNGRPQAITFDKLPDVKRNTTHFRLKGRADSGLPVSYYVVAGPAYIANGVLYFTPVPIKSEYPVKVTVVCYQWGRSIQPLYRSAEPVERSFYLLK
ncbi:hypothetical protein KXQ82_08455 [Mucilaginibacter sp. HMF5004]|uniref:hypothetical protein n=1 Tax=Mucilaginibacter rivuli TaxID=2857527 RepID=UPI001C5D9C87|nr:hypothetical protein [Mucilaginibacter rivuli]MBW4889745.1 hypothetical protein [Mucilaginibacter rivuli]